MLRIVKIRVIYLLYDSYTQKIKIENKINK